MRTGPALAVTAAQARAYRLAVHHLDEKLPAGWLVEAATPYALEDAGSAWAALALAARVEDLVPAEVDRAVLVERSLVRMHALRGVVHVVARQGCVVFGPGALAADERSLRDQLRSDWLALEAAGWRAREALALVSGVVAALLADGQPRTTTELHEALHGQVPRALEPWCERCRDHHVPDRLLRLAGAAGTFCFGHDAADGAATLVSPEGWLGGHLGGSLDRARVELARRFLHAFAPTVPEHLAACVGIGVDDAHERFTRLAFEVVEVDFHGRPAWVPEADVPLVADPPAASGVRLLPPDDPLLHQRDRATLVPDPLARRQVWEPLDRPGLVLAGGRPLATWWAQAFGSRLHVTAAPLGEARITRRDAAAIGDEAAVVAPFFGCEDVSLDVAS